MHKLPVLQTPITNPLVNQLLQKNHNEHHIFFRERLHNHYPHVLLSEYALGASDQRLKKEWSNEPELVKIPSRKPEKITEENFKNHIGDESFYPNYLDFFDSEIKKNGTVKTIVKYVYDDDVFPCVVSGAVHPLIHIAFGVDFQTDLVVAEGLAEALVQGPQSLPILEFIKKTPTSSSSSVSLLKIFQDVYDDKDIKGAIPFEEKNKIDETLRIHATKINSYASMYKIEPTEQGIVNALEELYSMSTDLLFATSFHPALLDQTKKKDVPAEELKKIKLDFFLMHLVTSILSVRTLLPHLEISKAVQLLQAHVASELMYYIARGLPPLNQKQFSQFQPSQPIESWSAIINLATKSFELHVPKAIRSLLIANELFAAPDEKRGGAKEQESKFFKGAVMVAERLVNLKEDWDMSVLGYKESWKDEDNKKTDFLAPKKEDLDKHFQNHLFS